LTDEPTYFPRPKRRAAERDAATARAIFNEQRANFVKRLDSESDDGNGSDDDAAKAKKPRVEDAPKVSVVVKRPTVAVKAKVKPKAASPPPAAGLGGILGDYGSDSQS